MNQVKGNGLKVEHMGAEEDGPALGTDLDGILATTGNKTAAHQGEVARGNICGHLAQ
jgi:hypothetical protein